MYEKQAKAIKRFVSFNVRDKGIKAKSLHDKVRRYYRLIYGADGGEALYNPATDVPMSFRSAKTRAAVMASEGQTPYRGIKVVFVETVEDPLNPGKLLKPRIRLKGGKVLKSNFDVTQSFYPFRVKVSRRVDLEEAFTDDIKRILKEAPHVRKFVVKCAKRQTESPQSRTKIIPYVLYLIQRYRDTFHDWLRGLVAYEFETTASLQSFLKDRDMLRKGKSGRKARRRNRR